MESALLSNGNTMEFPEPEDSQVFSQTRAREKAKIASDFERAADQRGQHV